MEFFQEQFKENNFVENYAMLDYIPRCVSDVEMCRLSTKVEVRKVVFELTGSSACGPDGFTGQFYQECWEIIGVDITKMVCAFFADKI